MKKLVKAWAVLAALAMLGSSFVSCGSGDDDGETSGGSGNTPAPKPAVTTTVTKADKVMTFEFEGDVTLGTGSVKVYDGETLIDTVNSADESFISGNNNNSIGSVNCGKQLIQADGKTVTVITHTDSNAYSQLLPGKTYKVVFDAALLGESADVEKTYATITTEKVSGTTINVGPNGDFRTIQGALDLIRENNSTGSWTIKVAEGTYLERLFYKGGADLRIEGPNAEFGSKVNIKWDNGNYLYSTDVGARGRAANFFNGTCNLVLKNISMENTSTKFADNQAEVLTFDSTGKLVAYNCTFKSHQDTHYIGAKGCRAWFYKCHIEGDVDFLWGYADVVLYEECELVALNNGKSSPQAVLIAARGDISQPANKGFVLLNNKITVKEGVSLAFARNSGADTNGAFINNEITTETGASVDSAIYRAATTTQVYDDNKDMAIGWKDFGSKVNDAALDTSARYEKCGALTERVVNREYNGRYAILNRGFNVSTNSYKEATKWDISAFEKEFNATADNSAKNVYIEPVAVWNVLAGTKVTLTATGTGTWAATEETPNTIIKTFANGVLDTNAGTEGTVTVTYTAANGHKDTAYVYVLATFKTATKVIINAAPTSINLGSFADITAVGKDDSDVDATLETVTWTTSDPSVILFVDGDSKKVETLTTTTKATPAKLYAVKAGTAKITATHTDGPAATTENITVSDATTEWSSFGAGVEVNTDVQSKAINFYNGMIIDTTAGGKCGMKTSSSDRNQSRQLTLYIPVTKDCDFIMDLTAHADGTTCGLDADGKKIIYTGSADESYTGPWQYKICFDYDTQAVDYATATANITDALKADSKKWVSGCDEKLAAIPTDTKFAAIVFPFAKDAYWKTITRVYDDSIDYTWKVYDISIAFEDTSDVELDLNGTTTNTRVVTVTGTDAADADITYSSDDTKVATVDSNGVVTAVAKGQCVIKAKEINTGKDVTYKVKVVDSAVVENGPKEVSLGAEYSEWLTAEQSGQISAGSSANYDGLVLIAGEGGNFKYDSGNKCMTTYNPTIKIPVTGDCKITVTSHSYNSQYIVIAGEAVTSGTTHEYTYTGEAGYVELTASDAKQCLYLYSIKIENIADTFDLGATYSEWLTAEQSGQISAGSSVSYNSLILTAGEGGNFKYDSGNKCMTTYNPTIKIPVIGNCKITVTSHSYNSQYIVIAGEAVTSGTTHEYTYTGEAGYVELTASDAKQCLYLYSIKVSYE